MKLLFLTFTIAVMVQVSVAVPVSRHKRDDLFVSTFEDTMKLIKVFVPGTETLLRNSLKDIPKTPAYAKYVQQIEEYLAEVQEFKSIPGNCVEKNAALVEKFVKFAEELDVDENTPEGKEFDKIIENNGALEFLKDIEEYSSKLDNPEVSMALENITPEDALKILPLMTEIC